MLQNSSEFAEGGIKMDATNINEKSVEIPYDDHPDIFRDSARVGSWWGQLSEGSVKVLVVAENAAKMALRDYLLGDSQVHVTGVARRLGDACRALRDANYDVVLIALGDHAADMGALLQLMDIHQPKARALVILEIDEGASLKRMFGSKVMGYLCYEDITRHLVASIIEVANGRFTVSPGLSRTILKLLEEHPANAAVHVHPTWQSSMPQSGFNEASNKNLSGRELEILKMVAAGHVSTGIANALGIRATTVNAHIRSIFGKLGCKTRAQAIHLGIQTGLFNEEGDQAEVCITPPMLANQ